jgi:hypothetical protein
MSTSVENVTDVKTMGGSTDEIVEASIHLADKVVKYLIAATLAKPVDQLFDTCLENIGEIIIDTPSGNRYAMYLNLVDKDYMLDLGELAGNDRVKQCMVYILNSANMMFRCLSTHLKKTLPGGFDYTLNTAYNTTLYLDEQLDTRIGIILKEIV